MSDSTFIFAKPEAARKSAISVPAKHRLRARFQSDQPRFRRPPAPKLCNALIAGLAFAALCCAGRALAAQPSPQIVAANLIKDKIVAITRPKFVAANQGSFLQPRDPVIGLVVGKVPRAYPLRILVWHEVVNDAIGGKPIAVTYCPLTGDGAVYERAVGGKTVTMSSANKLYAGSTLFSDSATHSLWSQFDGKAIAGPQKGKHLAELASIMTTWALWQAYHPNTQVLSTDTGVARNYNADPYAKYKRPDGENFPVSNGDQRLGRDELVLGVDLDHHAEAFPLSRMVGAKMPITTRLGDRKVTIFFDPATGTAGAADETQHIPAYTGYWFGWSAFHPHSEIWGKAPPKPLPELPIIFKEAGDLSHAREGESATLLQNGKVLIAGGDNGRAPMLAAAELYDPARHTFTATGKMAYPRGGHDATLLADGKVLITGGIDDLNIIGNAEVYDPATGRFKAVEPMSIKRQKHTATLLNNGQVLIAGGYSGDASPTSSTELYDPAKGRFIAGPEMSAARQNHAAIMLPDGRVLLTGGMGGKGRISNSAEIYDPATGHFTPAGQMISVRQGHTATLLKNGQVLITGGASDEVAALTSAEVYDPKSNRFTPAGNMSEGRQGHRAVPLGNGDVLIVGGGGIDPRHRYLASVELYDPSTQKFTLLGEMLLPRFGPTLTLLDDGDVLVTGRFSAPNYFATATAEIYKPPAKVKQ